MSGGDPLALTVTVLRDGAPDARAAFVWQPAVPSEGAGSGGRSLRGSFQAMAGFVACLACLTLGVVVVRGRRRPDPLAGPATIEGDLVSH